jgi:hypothetical protein
LFHRGAFSVLNSAGILTGKPVPAHDSLVQNHFPCCRIRIPEIVWRNRAESSVFTAILQSQSHICRKHISLCPVNRSRANDRLTETKSLVFSSRIESRISMTLGRLTVWPFFLSTLFSMPHFSNKCLVSRTESPVCA